MKASRKDRWWFRQVWLIMVFCLSACQVPTEPGSVIATSPASTLLAPGESWYSLYFSDPTNPDSVSLRGGPDAALAAAIRRARLSVDLAVYDLDLWSVRDALIDAHRRGIQVRMVTDSDNLGEPEIQDLIGAGIEVIGDRHEGLMHNKFLIIDGREVWTGSMNLTINSAYRNNDNLLRITSPVLSQYYQAEFDEMFTADLFGQESPGKATNPTIQLSDSEIQVLFSPEDRVEEQIVALILAAEESIQFMAYSFTSDKIAAAMLKRAEEGVNISGVFEEEQTRSNRGSEYDTLRAEGLDVRKDGNPRNMHHKVILIDDQITVTGSYNFTNNARTINDENLLVIHSRGITQRYREEFQSIFHQAHP